MPFIAKSTIFRLDAVEWLSSFLLAAYTDQLILWGWDQKARDLWGLGLRTLVLGCVAQFTFGSTKRKSLRNNSLVLHLSQNRLVRPRSDILVWESIMRDTEFFSNSAIRACHRGEDGKTKTRTAAAS